MSPFLVRLKVVKRVSDGLTIGEYAYDAMGRRVEKIVTNGGLSGTIPNGTTRFLYHSGISQCCEERDGSNNPQKQYVWGVYIDELIQQKVDISGTPVDQYPLCDTLYRTVALTNDTGSIIEAYDYDAYGNTLIFSAPGTGGNWWADDATQTKIATCDFLFTGRRYDVELEIYFYRARHYLPQLGRFTSRDSAFDTVLDANVETILGTIAASCQARSHVANELLFGIGRYHQTSTFDIAQSANPPEMDEFMNLYLYCRNNPALFGDPSGALDCNPTCGVNPCVKDRARKICWWATSTSAPGCYACCLLCLKGGDKADCQVCCTHCFKKYKKKGAAQYRQCLTACNAKFRTPPDFGCKHDRHGVPVVHSVA